VILCSGDVDFINFSDWSAMVDRAGDTRLTFDDRQEVADAYEELAAGTGMDYLKVLAESERFRYCGHKKRVYECPDDHHNYWLPCTCNSRLCDRCNQRQYYKLKKSLVDRLQYIWSRPAGKTYGPKFMTLTFKKDRFEGGFPDRDEFRKCQDQVRQFVTRFYSRYGARQSRNGNWYVDRSKKRGCGAISMPEIGPSCNLHFHLLLYGPYIPREKLIEAWKEITVDSWYLWIAPADKLNGAVSYVLKYMTKTPDLDCASDLARWAFLIKGFRRLATYGIFYNAIKRNQERQRMDLSCPYCGTGLKYRGEGFDRANALLDFVLLKNAAAARDGPLIDYSLFPGGYADDKKYCLEDNFKLEGGGVGVRS
jgi:hypothetical protein